MNTDEKYLTIYSNIASLADRAIKPGFSFPQDIFGQIICWYSRSTTTVMEVKLHYFCGCGSTMAVAVKNQV